MKFTKQIVLLSVAVGVAGCQTAPGNVWQSTPSTQGNDVTFSEPSPYQAPPAPQPVQQMPMQQQAMMMDPTASALMLQQINTLGEALNHIQERVQRVEKAMVRLDRRMQLVERNELERMSLLPGMENPSGPTASLSSDTPNPLPSLAQPGLQAQDFGFGRMTPVSHVVGGEYNNGQVTSALQPYVPVQAGGSQAHGAVSNLPSLADPTHVQKIKDTSLAVWTVQFEPQKIWPDRQQLPAAREVVEALRGDKPIALYARGQATTSRAFRDRVRALSRYLSKVSNLDNVPIATLPAPHLDSDTIEIFATQ
jgi:hypothetical protein